jgi:hypothetical protein
MARQEFDEVWDIIMNLSPSEWRRLRRLMNALLANGKPVRPEDVLDFKLPKKGVISRIPPPITDTARSQDFKPAPIEGQPLSETITEERR